MAEKHGAVGCIGLGIMGSAMTGNLVKAGFHVVGYDVDAARMEALVQAGGHAAPSAAEVAQRCELLLTSLPSVKALHETVQSLLSKPRQGLIVAETSTLPLEEKQAAHGALAAAGITLLDSPVSGTGSQAVNKDIVVFSSGDMAAYGKFLPVYHGIARATHHLGQFGNGMRLKCIANLLVAIHSAAAGEAIALAKRAGLDAEMAYSVLAESAGASRMFQVRGPSMVAGKYQPAGMKLDLWMKDLNIIGAFAAGLHFPTPLFSAAAQLYQSTMAQRAPEDDLGAVCAVLEQMAGIGPKG